jgi:VIT1/CCC1 family predicted Fe2+/Mn2+ transporter
LVGVIAAGTGRAGVLTAGIAGLVAGAMSMAAGEYVSVSSQSDTERADLRREAGELEDDPQGERRELAKIYVRRGLTAELADEVALQLMKHDALGTHARDELSQNEATAARPVLAAVASAVAFALGAGLPLGAAAAAPEDWRVQSVVGASLVLLAALGAVGALIGGAQAWRGGVRVTIWGALAMAVTAAIGASI